jgi:8-oxo-dGTP diphosphatase
MDAMEPASNSPMRNRDAPKGFAPQCKRAAGTFVTVPDPEVAAQGPTQPRRAVVGAALVDDLTRPSMLLAARRTEPPELAGGWELPGGKVDPGETEVEAVHRELHEELGVVVELGALVEGPLPDGRWPLGDRFAMRVWIARVTSGEPRPIEDHDRLQWLDATDLYAVPWLPADLPIVRVVSRAMNV